MSGRIARVLVLLVVVLALAGCGKKGAPQPPPDSKKLRLDPSQYALQV